MTKKEKLFIEAYSTSHNSAQAARIAGYSECSARTIGYRLLHKDHIFKAIQGRESETARQMELTRETVLQGMLDAIELAKLQANPMAQINGYRQLALICGFYRAETLHRAEVTDSGKAYMARMASLSDSELVAIIEGDCTAH